VAASNDNDVMTGKLETDDDDLPQRLSLARSSPGFGIIDGNSIPAFLRKSKLSVQSATLDGTACLVLRGVRDNRDITVWLDPALNYVARRVLFDKRSTPSDLTIRTYQFDAKRFQYEASGPIVAEATCTLTIGPQPIFQSIGYVKVVNGKTIIESPLLPAKGADGKIIMQPARCCRWEIHTVACDRDPHFRDADFRMTVPIKNGTRISMSDAPMSQYVWKDGAVHAGGWKRNLSLYQNRRTNSASERFARSLRDARLCSLCVLVAAMGDATEPLEEALGKVLDFEESKDSLRYLPVTLTAAEVQSQNGFFDKLNLHPPKAGEILLAAFAGDGRQIGTLLLSSGDIASGGRRGIDFLKAHAPAARDARKLLAEAQKKARETDRRVWIVEGGSRCGPCFRLARWMDDQHALLDQDYVIVKFIGGVDEHVDEVLARFHISAEAGVPWFAITDTEGTPLATSDGPHGNIGFPSEQAEKLHFLMMLQKTAQRLNTGERDQLVKSLGD
jgi:hypothetical protein